MEKKDEQDFEKMIKFLKNAYENKQPFIVISGNSETKEAFVSIVGVTEQLVNLMEHAYEGTEVFRELFLRFALERILKAEKS
jgi:hypothetical protein